jgi:hypothetical protein
VAYHLVRETSLCASAQASGSPSVYRIRKVADRSSGTLVGALPGPVLLERTEIFQEPAQPPERGAGTLNMGGAGVWARSSQEDLEPPTTRTTLGTVSHGAHRVPYIRRCGIGRSRYVKRFAAVALCIATGASVAGFLVATGAHMTTWLTAAPQGWLLDRLLDGVPLTLVPASVVAVWRGRGRPLFQAYLPRAQGWPRPLYVGVLLLGLYCMVAFVLASNEDLRASVEAPDDPVPRARMLSSVLMLAYASASLIWFSAFDRYGRSR